MTREEMISMYKIRKLTEKECGRLQGVKDKDIDAIRSVCSKSACYKLYGNSICVPVLMGIFSQLNIQGIPSWNECIDKKNGKKNG